jgi:adenosylmethionine-8-amino-7-oxononanoate aminotransferase
MIQRDLLPASFLARRSLAAVWHPCTQMQRAVLVPPLPIVRGEGPWLFDDSGHRYFDTSSSWWVNLFSRIDAAIKDQLDTLPRLSALTDGVLGHCFFASDGDSAVEIALSMCVLAQRSLGSRLRWSLERCCGASPNSAFCSPNRVGAGIRLTGGW